METDYDSKNEVQSEEEVIPEALNIEIGNMDRQNFDADVIVQPVHLNASEKRSVSDII